MRTKDSARTLARVLTLLRSQTVPCEIIVVDSGSSDDTLAVARTGADLVLEIPAERFSFGRALNVGAAAAYAPTLFALSSHSFPPHDRWIERSLSMYDRPDVAATNGARRTPGRNDPLTATFHQTLADAIERPWWGFSNTGSSFRAKVWAQCPFDEELAACEDKEWGLRVLGGGWTIAFDPLLCTSSGHRTVHGIPHLYRRTRREYQALGSFANLPRATVDGLVHEWWCEMTLIGRYRRWRRRLSPSHLAELAGKYHGIRVAEARAPLRSRPSAAPSAFQDAQRTI